MSQNRLQLFYCNKLWKSTFIALEIVCPEFWIHSCIRTAIVQNSSATCTTLSTENPLLWASIRFSEIGRSHRERALANGTGVQAQWFFYLLKTASPTKLSLAQNPPVSFSRVFVILSALRASIADLPFGSLAVHSAIAIPFVLKKANMALNCERLIRAFFGLGDDLRCTDCRLWISSI